MLSLNRPGLTGILRRRCTTCENKRRATVSSHDLGSEALPGRGRRARRNNDPSQFCKRPGQYRCRRGLQDAMQTLTLTKTESPRSVAAGAGVCDAGSNPSPDSAASDIASGVQPLRSSYSRRAVNLDRASAPAASNKNSFPRAMGHATCLTESHWDAESHKAHWGSGACTLPCAMPKPQCFRLVPASPVPRHRHVC